MLKIRVSGHKKGPDYFIWHFFALNNMFTLEQGKDGLQVNLVNGVFHRSARAILGKSGCNNWKGNSSIAKMSLAPHPLILAHFYGFDDKNG